MQDVQKKRLTKTTQNQYECLINFIEKNKIILHGKCNNSNINSMPFYAAKFAEEMNSSGLGALKTADQWFVC